MSIPGWDRLLTGSPWDRGEGAYPIAAYSEFMPAPRMVVMPYGTVRPGCRTAEDGWGWSITEHEEAFELRPGLEQVAAQVIPALVRLGHGTPGHGIARHTLIDNPYWPPRLAERAGSLTHERHVVLMPLALSRTQDDKGRLRWTLFGGSEHGPSYAFWRGFFAAPDRERPAEEALDFLRGLLATAFGETPEGLADLRRAGLRILPQGTLEPPLPSWPEGPLPQWTRPLLWARGRSLRGVKFLLTFRPFGALPEVVQHAYLAGGLHLLPSPASLLFWGAPLALRLRHELPSALQFPLLSHVEHHNAPHGLRVPQSGWMHEPRPEGEVPEDHRGPVRNTVRRTHRMARVERDALDESGIPAREDRVAHVLFDASEAIGLYGKPMARNAQVWTNDGRLLLDGPDATHDTIARAAHEVGKGGLFGYRFVYPAMRVGRHEVTWHRPLVACLPAGADRPVVLHKAPLGSLIANCPQGPAATVELWPRLLSREAYEAAATLFTRGTDPQPQRTGYNCRKLLDARAYFEGQALSRSFARRLLTAPEHETLEDWLDALPGRSDDPARGQRLADELRRGLEPESSGGPAPEPITFGRTAKRSFEVAFWKTIARLSGGRFPNRNNADCARDATTRRALVHDRRDLGRLGDHLLACHTRAIKAAGMSGRALAGDLPFHWRTDFAFNWSDGWRASQGAEPPERDLIVVIPGRDRSRAIIMADHYDTAYMEDRYREDTTRSGPRLAAPGADDNSSATAALLLAAPSLLALSRAGRLGCDVWLVHLTGEEFPADCLGARHLAQRLVEGTLAVRLPGRGQHDLSGVRVGGVYVLDMVAHDNPHRRGTFQIAPGDNPESWRLALEAHLANETWNASVPAWNRHPARRGAPRRRRARAAPTDPPPIARHPVLHGEVRPHDDPRSTLFNTDAQIFSDAGIPAVLFMEDYDIDRSGYHDSHDTMAGIDLDFGAALVAIAIEAVARAAWAVANPEVLPCDPSS